MKYSLRFPPSLLVIASALLIVTGCAPKRGDFKGKVTYLGKPLASGYVNVEGGDKTVTGCEIRRDGSYEVKDVVIGQISVSVFSPDPGSAAVISRNPEEVPPPKDRSGWFAIPDMYNDFSKSGLSFSLKPGPNTIDIDLK